MVLAYNSRVHIYVFDENIGEFVLVNPRFLIKKYKSLYSIDHGEEN